MAFTSSTSNFTGAIAVNYGSITATSNNGLGSSSNTITVASGAALQVQSGTSIAQPLNLAGTGVGGTGALISIGGSTVAGPITLSANATIDSGASGTTLTLTGGIVESTFTPTFAGTGDFNASGAISGSGGLVSDARTVARSSGSSNFTGSVAVNAGVLIVESNNALGSTGNTVTVASGANQALEVQGSISISQPLSLAGTGQAGALASIGGNNTVAGPITLTANAFIGNTISGTALTLSGGITDSTFTLTFVGPGNVSESGAISGSGGLVKGSSPSGSDTGTLTLSSGTSNFTGNVAIHEGVVNVQSNNALGSGSNTVSVVATNAALQVQGGISIAQPLSLAGTGVGGTGALDSAGGNNTVAGSITLAANSTIGNTASGTTLTLSGGIVESTFTPTFSGVGNISESGTISGSGGLASNDTSTLVLSGATSNFTGAVAINDGVVNIQSNNALGSTGNTVTVASGAELDLAGSISISQPLVVAGTGAGVTGDALAGVGGNATIDGLITLTANATIGNTASGTALTLNGGGINENTFTPTITGVGNVTITFTPDIAGSGGLIKGAMPGTPAP